jgi:hypothetical protein
MGYYPMCLDMAGRPCLVVGGGPPAERKVVGLLQAGARLTVVSPRVTPQLDDWAREGRIRLIRRRYEASDLAGQSLVFVATDDGVVNAEVARDARAAGVLINAADDLAHCDFILPAMLRRGPGNSGSSFFVQCRREGRPGPHTAGTAKSRRSSSAADGNRWAAGALCHPRLERVGEGDLICSETSHPPLCGLRVVPEVRESPLAVGREHVAVHAGIRVGVAHGQPLAHRSEQGHRHGGEGLGQILGNRGGVGLTQPREGREHLVLAHAGPRGGIGTLDTA